MLDYNALRMYKRRFDFLKYVLILYFIILLIKLFFIQIIHGGYFNDKARKISIKKEEIKAKRGNIYDRNGNLLATDIAYGRIETSPNALRKYFIKSRRDKYTKNGRIKLTEEIEKQVRQDYLDYIDAISDSVSYYLRLDKKYVLSKLKENKWNTVLVDNLQFKDFMRFLEFYERDKMQSQIKKGKKHKLCAYIYPITNYKRLYPFGSVAGQIIGYVNAEEEGKSGIEMVKEKILQGVNGYRIKGKDSFGNDIILPNTKVVEAKNGEDIYLTIDINVQNIVDDELAKSVQKYGALAGHAVVLDLKKHEIIAMSSYPFFDPNDYKKSIDYAQPKCLVDMYEPGSIFKLISATIAINEKIVKTTDIINCSNGKIEVGGKIVKDSHPYGDLTYEQIIAYSSNIGIYKSLQRLPENKRRRIIYDYIRDYGLIDDVPLGVFPTESKGMLKSPDKWTSISEFSIPIGQEVSLTSLAIANAYSAIANKGTLYRPILIIGDEPLKIRSNIFSNETYKILMSLMEKVVEYGTAKAAIINGLKIGGKTGTAQKAAKDGSGYLSGKYFSSFVGIFPLDNPKFLILVSFDEPSLQYYYASMSAVPTFRNIVLRLLLNSSEYLEESIKVEKSITSGGDELKITKADVIKTNPLTKKEMPNLIGLTLREAAKKASTISNNITINGSGIVISQSPSAGTIITDDDIKIIIKAGAK